jgi:hypothetical protein
MPNAENDKVSGTLQKLADELGRQTKERDERDRANEAKIHEILSEGLKGLDAGLHDLGAEFSKCCPLRPGGMDKTSKTSA